MPHSGCTELEGVIITMLRMGWDRKITSKEGIRRETLERVEGWSRSEWLATIHGDEYGASYSDQTNWYVRYWNVLGAVKSELDSPEGVPGGLCALHDCGWITSGRCQA